MTTVWKIVEAVGLGEFRSGYVFQIENVLLYHVGKKTVPSFGKIFAFSSFEAALRYQRGDLCKAIFEATTSKVTQPSGGMLYGGCARKTYEHFWNAEDKKRFLELFHHQSVPPEGTVWCDDLTLVERVA